MRVDPDGSYVNLPSKTVINVDTVLFYDAAYPGGVAITQINGGSTIYVRAVVSDPFGSFDITSATVDIIDSATTTVVSAAAMTEVNDSGTLTKTYEYAYAVPGTGPAGVWNARVTANEGSEGTVSHTASNTFDVLVIAPNLLVLKSVSTSWDPTNLAVNPKAIPGARVTYTINSTNQGYGSPDVNTVFINDTIPANTTLYVAGATPISFTDGAVTSALTYTYGGLADLTDDVEFFDGAVWTYVPTAGADGCDPVVQAIRINPKGTFAAATGGPPPVNIPGFDINFTVCVQ